MEVRKHKPLAYRLYDYLQANHLGEENGINRDYLAITFGETVVGGVSVRELRKLIQTINESEQFEKLVSVSGSIYICRTAEECQRAIHATYAPAITLFKKAKKMERKYSAHGQFKIKLGKFFKEFVSTFSDEEMSNDNADYRRHKATGGEAQASQ